MAEIGETVPITPPPPEPEPVGQDDRPKNTLRNIGIGLVVLLVLAAIGAAIYGLATHPLLTAVVRDIFIIVLALVTIVIGLFLVILIFQLQSLIALLRDEIKPILNSTNQTVSTVRGTTTFVSENLVKPMIETASLTAGFVGGLRALAGTGRQKRHRKRARAGEKE
jgi:hypothetical protein